MFSFCKKSKAKKNKTVLGFTLAEVLVALGVMSVILSTVAFSVSEVRTQARDKQRLMDIEKIKMAIKLQNQNVFIDQLKGNYYEMICKEGCAGQINEAIQEYVGSMEDPMHDAVNYYYYVRVEYKPANPSGYNIDSKICANKMEGTGSEYCEEKFTSFFVPNLPS